MTNTPEAGQPNALSPVSHPRPPLRLVVKQPEYDAMQRRDLTMCVVPDNFPAEIGGTIEISAEQKPGFYQWPDAPTRFSPLMIITHITSDVTGLAQGYRIICFSPIGGATGA